MKWRGIENHIVGKIYDLTQENMNALIEDVEKLTKALNVAKDGLIYCGESEGLPEVGGTLEQIEILCDSLDRRIKNK